MDQSTTIYKDKELTSIAKRLVKGKGQYVRFYLRVRNEKSPTLVAVYRQQTSTSDTEITHAL